MLPDPPHPQRQAGRSTSHRTLYNKPLERTLVRSWYRLQRTTAPHHTTVFDLNIDLLYRCHRRRPLSRSLGHLPRPAKHIFSITISRISRLG